MGKICLPAPEKELIELRRHKMGMVFQHFALLPHLTVLEQCRLSARDRRGHGPCPARGPGPAKSSNWSD